MRKFYNLPDDPGWNQVPSAVDSPADKTSPVPSDYHHDIRINISKFSHKYFEWIYFAYVSKSYFYRASLTLKFYYQLKEVNIIHIIEVKDTLDTLIHVFSQQELFMFITENEVLAFWIPILIWYFDALIINMRLEEHVKNEVIRGIFASLISTVTLPLAFLTIQIFKYPIKYLSNTPCLLFAAFVCIMALCELIKSFYKKVKEKLWKMF